MLRSDRGGKYLSEEFKNYCFKHSIKRELTQARTPQQNGVSERRNRTIMERARSIAADCHLPMFLWPEAVAMATYLINRSPTRSNYGIPPESSYTGKPVDLRNLRIFDCMAHVHVPQEERKKLDKRSHACIFVGYDVESKEYRLYDHIRKKIIISRDVVFDESRVGFSHLKENFGESAPHYSFGIPLTATDSFESQSGACVKDSNGLGGGQQTPRSPVQVTHSPSPSTIQDPTFSTNLSFPPQNNNSLSPEDTTSTAIGAGPITTTTFPHTEGPGGHANGDHQAAVDGRRGLATNEHTNVDAAQVRTSSRQRRPSQRLKDYWTLNSELIEEPLHFHEAVQYPGWKAAIESEVDSVLSNHTWEVVDRPIGRKPITAKWIFKTKKASDISKFKARTVARGFQQHEGVDYDDIFAPVARWSTIRIILALVAQNNWDLHQIDVVTTFLNGTVNEDILMEILEGFPEAGNPSKVCKLKRALYGLKQAPRIWYARMDDLAETYTIQV